MVKIPPPLWVVLYLVIFGAVSWVYPWRTLVDLRSVWLGALLVATALSIAGWAVVLFRRAGTALNPVSATNTALVVRGPFRFSRNPMYLALVLLTLGIAFRVGALPLFAVPLLVFVTAQSAHIPFEEESMRRQFGAAFDAYRRRVRRWI